MNVPNCPTHGSPMRAGNKGGFYCPRKMPDQTYCPQRIKAATVQTYTNPEPSVTVRAAGPEGPTTNKHLMLIACIDAASRVYQGTGQDVGFIALINELLLIHGEA